MKLTAIRTFIMKDKKFIILSSIFFLLFIFSIGSLLIGNPLSNYIKAATVTVSASKSIITALPQACSVSNNAPFPCAEKKIKVDVYVRSEGGDLIPNRTVQLSTQNGIADKITISPSGNQITNTFGKAEFILSSDTIGKTDLIAKDITDPDSAKHIQIAQPLSIEFTP